MSINGFRVQGGVRFYPINKTIAPRGLWLGPHFSYMDFKIKPKNSYSKDYIEAIHLNMNILVGYQFIAGRVVFDLYTGIGYKKNDWTLHYATGTHRFDDIYGDKYFPFYANPIKLNFGANLGLAF